ncbi:hypothetical protein HP550_20285, partial [Cellulomonas humilata]|nr:hypothetical protein [Cellulomonas humilata]
MDGRGRARRPDDEVSTADARAHGRPASVRVDVPVTVELPRDRVTAPGLQRLQRLAGNRAVTQALGRGAPRAPGVAAGADPRTVLDQSVIRSELSAVASEPNVGVAPGPGGRHLLTPQQGPPPVPAPPRPAERAPATPPPAPTRAGPPVQEEIAEARATAAPTGGARVPAPPGPPPGEG